MNKTEAQQAAIKRQQVAKRDVQGLKVVACKPEDYPKNPKRDVLYVIIEEA